LKLLPRIKHDKFIISLTNLNDLEKEISAKGIRIYFLGLHKYNFLKIILKFKEIINKEKPDILDTYLIHSNIFGRIFGKIFGVKIIINSVRNDYSDLKIYNFIDKYTRWLVDKYVPNSQALVDYLHYKNNVSLKNIFVLPNGIELDKISNNLYGKDQIRSELKLSNDSFIAVCVSRLRKHKNIVSLVSAMRYVNKKIILLLIGQDQGEKNNIIHIIDRYNLKNQVYLLGARTDIQNILTGSDIFILPSLKEGMSNALLEAMAHKKCCVVSNIPQNTELVKHKQNGFIFNPKDELDIADKIEKAYNHKDLNEMALASYNIVKEKYDINIVAELYDDFMNKMIKINYK